MLTFGFILGEVVRRVSGGSVREFLGARLLDPLGARGTFVGLPGNAAVKPNQNSAYSSGLSGVPPAERCQATGVGESGTGSKAAGVFAVSAGSGAENPRRAALGGVARPRSPE
ncbi:MAG: serine hydrolase [Actinocrinis sp.]